MNALPRQQANSGDSQSIELFGFPTSPYTIKVAGYLAYKNLPYQFTGVDPLTYRQIAFTGVRQVPVLRIGDEYRADSDDIALWLEERFPDRCMLPATELEKEKVRMVNDWINQSVIPAMFRLSVDWPTIVIGLTNGWKLGRAVHQSTGLPLWCRLLWPVFVKKAGFVNHIVDTLDRQESLHSLQKRLLAEFEQKLDAGPFLSGLSQPSLTDISLYPLMVFGYQLQLSGDIPWRQNSSVIAWMDRVRLCFDQEPSLIKRNGN